MESDGNAHDDPIPMQAAASRGRRRSHHAANDPFFEAAWNAAHSVAYQTAASAQLSAADREDLFQEIMLVILARRDRYDPTKGQPNTFTGFMALHCAADFFRSRATNPRRAVSARVGEPDSFAFAAIGDDLPGVDPDEEAANDDEIESAGIERLAGASPVSDEDADHFACSDTLIDLRAAIAYMSEEQATLLDLLASHQNLPDAARASGVSTATFYRRVAELQLHLRMFGIRSAA